MADFRQKHDQTADLEFRRGFEELVHGCMASTAGVGGGADESFDRRRRRSDFEGDDLAESSAAVRRHSRILSRWITRQAEEMITTIERRNHESELMALAGLHTVSMLDSSFLRESRRNDESPVERPAPVRASSVLERWRELERNRNRNAIGLEIDDEDRSSSRENSPEVGEGERERVRQIVRGMTEGSRRLERIESQSPRAEWLGETERERVRLVREWVQMASQQQRDVRSGGRRNEEGQQQQQQESMRRDLLRVRGRQARLDLIMRIARERQRELQGLSEHRVVSDFAHRNRIQVKNCNVQFCLYIYVLKLLYVESLWLVNNLMLNRRENLHLGSLK